MPHRSDVVKKVIEDACQVPDVFDHVEKKREAMQSLLLPPPAQQVFAKAALTYRFGEEHQPITQTQALNSHRWQDESSDLWTAFIKLPENLIRGALSGRTAQGKRSHTRAIDGDLKLNRALWVMAEESQQALR